MVFVPGMESPSLINFFDDEGEDAPETQNRVKTRNGGRRKPIVPMTKRLAAPTRAAAAAKRKAAQVNCGLRVAQAQAFIEFEPKLRNSEYLVTVIGIKQKLEELLLEPTLLSADQLGAVIKAQYELQLAHSKTEFELGRKHKQMVQPFKTVGGDGDVLENSAKRGKNDAEEKNETDIEIVDIGPDDKQQAPKDQRDRGGSSSFATPTGQRAPSSSSNPFTTPPIIALSAPATQASPATANLAPSVQSSVALSASSPIVPVSAVEQPKIYQDLPTFNGRAASWLAFKNEMGKLVGNNPTLPESTKIRILAKQSSMDKLLIETCDYYDDAITAMSRRYENRNAVAADLLRLVQDLPVMQRPGSQEQWLKFDQVLLMIKRQIPVYGDYFEHTIYNAAKDRLGPYLEFFIREQLHAPNLSGMSAFINKQIEITLAYQQEKLRRGASGSGGTAPGGAPGGRGMGGGRGRPEIRVNAAREDGPCHFCDGTHWRRHCPLSKTERKQALYRKNRCYRCLEPRENGHRCQSHCSQCKGPNNFLICKCAEDSSSRSDPSAPRDMAVPTLEEPLEETTFYVSCSNLTMGTRDSQAPQVVGHVRANVTFLNTIKVMATDELNERKVVVRTLVDSGSTSSFINVTALAEIDAPRRRIRPSSVVPFGGAPPIQVTEEAEITIHSLVNPSVSHKIKVLVMSACLVGALPTPDRELVEQAKEHGVVLPDAFDGPEVVELLIGHDLYHDVFLKENQRVIKPQNGMSYVEYQYGWSLGGSPHGINRTHMLSNSLSLVSSGPTSSQSDIDYINFTSQPHVCCDLNKLLRDPMSEDGETIVLQQNFVAEFWAKIVYDSIKRRYTVALPWKGPERPDPNYHAAVAQLHALRLLADSRYDEYDQALMEFVNQGYAEILESYEPNEGYVIPHFPVYKQSSETTPCRPVFNASASTKDRRSLNVCIFSGIWKQVQVVEMILRWRLNPATVVGDIKKAFLQIHIQEKDRKYLRFLWYVDGSMRMLQMRSLLFGAAASPFILHAVLKHLFTTHAPELLSVVDNTYMDDSGLFADNTEKLKALMARVQEVFALGSFTLHKWLATPDTAAALGLESKSGVTCWLGSKWDLERDVIKFDIPPRPESPLTRRKLASVFGLPFDVLGLLGPCHTRARLFFRKMMDITRDWDLSLSTEQEIEADAILNDLNFLPDLEFPRVVLEDKSDYELWIFGDASSVAYGICVYVYNLKSGKVNLLVSRGHLSPKSALKTIPRLELVAALLAAKTLDRIHPCLPRMPVRYRLFTDSTITLQRIRGAIQKIGEEYVKARVQKILSFTDVVDWCYVPTKLNPADIISRGTSLRLKKVQLLWLEGPDPTEIGVLPAVPRSRALSLVSASSTAEAVRMIFPSDHMNRIVEKTPFLRFRRLVSVMFNKFQEKYKILERYQEVWGEDLDLVTLKGVIMWHRIQSVSLVLEMGAVVQGASLSGTPLESLSVIVDRFGLVRMDRRLTHSDLPFETKFPLVLLDNPAVKNYLAYVHAVHVYHAGVERTVSCVRRNFHIVGVRRIVSEVVNECMRCRRYRKGVPFQVPMASLPKDRVTKGYAFQTIGIDLFGPLHSGSGHMMQKFYGLIFACTRSRAIHLELVESKDTQAIWRAFMRFMGIFGRPQRVYCDNEKSFIKTSVMHRQLNQLFKKAAKKIAAQYELEIIWRFNVPLAPWQGGHYERLIQSVKRTLNRVRLSQASTFEQIETVLREAQMMINSRPLLVNPREEPITPAHLIFGRPLFSLEPVLFPKNSKDDTLISYNRFQTEMEAIWMIWNQEYLIGLRSTVWKKTDGPVLNELVIIMDDHAPRYCWEVAIIRKLCPGKDGLIRKVQLVSLNGEVRMRAVHKLIPIERTLDCGVNEAKIASSIIECQGEDVSRSETVFSNLVTIVFNSVAPYVTKITRMSHPYAWRGGDARSIIAARAHHSSVSDISEDEIGDGHIAMVREGVKVSASFKRRQRRKLLKQKLEEQAQQMDADILGPSEQNVFCQRIIENEMASDSLLETKSSQDQDKIEEVFELNGQVISEQEPRKTMIPAVRLNFIEEGQMTRLQFEVPLEEDWDELDQELLSSPPREDVTFQVNEESSKHQQF